MQNPLPPSFFSGVEKHVYFFHPLDICDLTEVRSEVEGDTSGWLKPVDMDLGCSTILPGQ